MAYFMKQTFTLLNDRTMLHQGILPPKFAPKRTAGLPVVKIDGREASVAVQVLRKFYLKGLAA